MHIKNIKTAGRPVTEADKVLIMIHGRGASAEDILLLAQYFPVKDYALWAPQAADNTWYPYSFLAPPAQNEPWLSSALSALNETVLDVKENGMATDHIYFLGFSQGACLTLEFAARHAAKYGGIIAFTGGLIGDKLYPENYRGDFERTPVFIGSSDPDMHVPVKRVHATTRILEGMNAAVTEKIYDHMGHTINQDEIDQANTLIFK